MFADHLIVHSFIRPRHPLVPLIPLIPIIRCCLWLKQGPAVAGPDYTSGQDPRWRRLMSNP